MYKLFSTFVLFTLFSLKGLAFKDSTKYTNTIKFTPLRTLSFQNASLEFSFEKKYAKNFSTEFMASYLLKEGSLLRFSWIYPLNTKGYRLSIEERYYFVDNNKMGPYIAFEYNYMNSEYNSILRFTKDINPPARYNYIYMDSISIKKTTQSFNCKVGYQFNVNRFIIDMYGGLGIRTRSITHANRINEKDVLYKEDYFIINESNEKSTTISIPINIRIGYMF